jgi:DNA-binding NarL/FixJ family response regulator
VKPRKNEGMRAVVCDDDGMIRKVVGILLREVGVEVVGEADRAPDAINLVEAAQPDLLVLDVAMPGMTGIDALPAVKEAAPGCDVIVLTAFDVDPDSVKEAGGYAVLYKPGGIEEFEGLVRRLQEERAGV